MDLKPPLPVVAAKFAAACERCGVDYALIGGLAAGAYGSDIPTRDVDACVGLATTDRDRIDALLAALESAGFRINAEALARRAARGHTILFLMIGLVRLDVMLLKPDGTWDDALRYRRRVAAYGNEFWMAAPEDLLILKLVAGRPKDIEAVRKVLREQYRKLDLPRVRQSANRLSAKVPELPARLEALLAEAEEMNRLADLSPEE